MKYISLGCSFGDKTHRTSHDTLWKVCNLLSMSYGFQIPHILFCLFQCHFLTLVTSYSAKHPMNNIQHSLRNRHHNILVWWIYRLQFPRGSGKLNNPLDMLRAVQLHKVLSVVSTLLSNKKIWSFQETWSMYYHAAITLVCILLVSLIDRIWFLYTWI
jgi:hypothetical protein